MKLEELSHINEWKCAEGWNPRVKVLATSMGVLSNGFMRSNLLLGFAAPRELPRVSAIDAVQILDELAETMWFRYSCSRGRQTRKSSNLRNGLEAPFWQP